MPNATNNTAQAKAKKPRALVVLRNPDSPRSQGRRNPTFPNLDIRATAVRMQVNESHLCRCLNKRVRPGLKMCQKLATAFGMTLDEVVRIYDNENATFHIPGAA